MASSLSPDVMAAFLVGTLAGLTIWDNSNNEYYVPSDDIKTLVKDLAVYDAGVKLLLQQGFAEMNWRGLIIGKGGFRTIDYKMKHAKALVARVVHSPPIALGT